MSSNDRYETGRTSSSEDAFPDPWAGTPRDPRLPDGDVGSCRSDQGTMLYDRDAPGTYLIGAGVDLAEMT